MHGFFFLNSVENIWILKAFFNNVKGLTLTQQWENIYHRLLIIIPEYLS